MMLDKKIADALNKQVTNELEASHNYLAMAAYFDSDSLPGFGKWFRGHAQEEHDHAMRIYDYIYRRGGDVTIDAISAPKANWKNAEEAVTAAFKHEQIVTQQINDLFELCNKERDYNTQNMLHWFLAEQVEEEDLFRRTLELVQATGGDRWNLTELDSRMERPEASEG